MQYSKFASVDHAPVDTLGPMIEKSSQFPEHVNVGFYADRQQKIRLNFEYTNAVLAKPWLAEVALAPLLLSESNKIFSKTRFESTSVGGSL